MIKIKKETPVEMVWEMVRIFGKGYERKMIKRIIHGIKKRLK